MSTSDPDAPVAVNRGWTLQQITYWVVATAIFVALIAVLMPASSNGRQPGNRTQCKNNLKQIGLALHNYHDAYGSFPPAYTVDADGQRLHSWRTLILPYLDQQALYARIDLSRPWDDPVNAQAAQTRVPAYACPTAALPSHQTTYVAVVGEQTCFLGTQPRKLSEITDGPSSTLMVVEVPADHAVPWMSPLDAEAAQFLSISAKSKTQHMGGLHALCADGAVRYVRNEVSAAKRTLAITVNDGEPVEFD